MVTATYCVSFNLLFVGLSCGIILTYRILLNRFVSFKLFHIIFFSFFLLCFDLRLRKVFYSFIASALQGVEDFVYLKTLHAHDIAVRALAVCSDFAVAASGCDMGKTCIWDLNRLSYIRTLIPGNGKEVQFICISRTSCDVAVVANSGIISGLIYLEIDSRFT